MNRKMFRKSLQELEIVHIITTAVWVSPEVLKRVLRRVLINNIQGKSFENLLNWKGMCQIKMPASSYSVDSSLFTPRLLAPERDLISTLEKCSCSGFYVHCAICQLQHKICPPVYVRLVKYSLQLYFLPKTYELLSQNHIKA